LSSIEIGKKWISPHTLAKLSNALHIASFELFKPQNTIDSETQRYTDEIFRAILESINTIHGIYNSRLQDP
jgi:transcriptional regulator with XRE-family HTH domain